MRYEALRRTPNLWQVVAADGSGTVTYPVREWEAEAIAFTLNALVERATVIATKPNNDGPGYYEKVYEGPLP